MRHEEAPVEDDDADDLDEFDDELDDDENDEKTGVATVERLSSVDTWEMYRIVDQDTSMPIALIAIRVRQDGAQVADYALWRKEDIEEPGATGSLVREPDSEAPAMTWDDGERESTLRQLLYLNERDLGVEQDKIEFQLTVPEDSSDEESLKNEG